ncbi:conjugal transfer protein TraK [Duncaniella muris]|uniref:Conjugal transfer protein TraK n=2 Tax=Bacteroidales TaxID=171549 RepID=A0A2V1IHV2_9BACT|nr:conjugal transfer protein TraK [Duncaniella muris]PWB00267.1 conjugal transfer protein TraK [Duncaniella muris]ROT12437.1 conjugal transfer protein TraK [Muribaculaceae bacterium Isolate-102 (HZI)]
MLPGHSPHSDTFRKMPIKHLRRDRIVTRLKTTVCYPLIITTKHGYIENFHQYFFNLPPDNDYIKWTVGKAMYMADGTALKQKQALDENGFYSDIISSSAVCTIICDSIQFDEHTRRFNYYGTQIIKRRTRDLKRSMLTTGSIENVPRTQNNPHGLMITNWRTLENKDLDY